MNEPVEEMDDLPREKNLHNDGDSEQPWRNFCELMMVMKMCYNYREKLYCGFPMTWHENMTDVIKL